MMRRRLATDRKAEPLIQPARRIHLDLEIFLYGVLSSLPAFWVLIPVSHIFVLR